MEVRATILAVPAKVISADFWSVTWAKNAPKASLSNDCNVWFSKLSCSVAGLPVDIPLVVLTGGKLSCAQVLALWSHSKNDDLKNTWAAFAPLNPIVISCADWTTWRENPKGLVNVTMVVLELVEGLKSWLESTKSTSRSSIVIASMIYEIDWITMGKEKTKVSSPWKLCQEV